MANKVEQLKRRNWIKRNSIRENEDYFIKILSNYGFEFNKDYKFTCNYNGDSNINFTLNGKSYRIEVDLEERCYSLLEENKALNPKHKNREHCIEKFSGEEIIFDVIRFIKNNGLNKIINKGVM